MGRRRGGVARVHRLSVGAEVGQDNAGVVGADARLEVVIAGGEVADDDREPAAAVGGAAHAHAGPDDPRAADAAGEVDAAAPGGVAARAGGARGGLAAGVAAGVAAAQKGHARSQGQREMKPGDMIHEVLLPWSPWTLKGSRP